MLMDEPLAALDDARKAEILPYVERLRDEGRIPIVYVSHSLAEVARLATDVVVLAGGRVTASGSAAEVLASRDLLPPEDRDEAGALIELTLVGQDEAFALSLLASAAGEWRVPRLEAPLGTRVRARVRARDVMLALARPDGISALNVLAGRVIGVAAGEGPDALVDRGLRRRPAAGAGDAAVGAGAGAGPGAAEVFAIVKAVTFDRGNRPAPPAARA